ncbi:MAG: nucleotidyltransferase family protein [Gemmatimonadetes bacterium]|nr:nucleotidyltransferase family protein [Gemmatimonadota bacterium]
MSRDALAAILRGQPLTWDRVGCDPPAFLEICRAEDISPLIYRHLRDTPELASWPDEVRDALEHESRAAVTQELLIQRELTRVLDALGARGVHPVLFKGTALAYSRYPHPSLRPRSDTDLLIRQTDTGAVPEALSALGYAPSLLCDGELLFRQFELVRDDEFGVPHALDFHWAISTQAAFAGVLTYDELASRAVAAPALGANARVPAMVDALLLALIHPVMHHKNQQRLLWTYDVHLLASVLDPRGFQELVSRATGKRVAAVCAQGLRLAQDWFGTAVQQTVLDQLAAAPLSEQPTAAYLVPSRSWASETAANLRGLPRWRDRLRLLREIAVPSSTYMLQAYRVANSRMGKVLLPALYVHRGVRGMWRVLSGRK